MYDQNNNPYQATFFVIPSHIVNLPGMTLLLLKFYETIFQFWNHGKVCFLSNSMIMERIGVKSVSSIIDAFKFFEEHGEMKRVTQNGKRYIIRAEQKIETDCIDTPIATAIPPYRHGDTPPIATAIHNIKNIKSKNIKSFTPSATQSAKKIQSNSLEDKKEDQSDLDNRFEQFFAAYPLKKNRHQCYKLWLKLKPSDELLSTILADIKKRLEEDSFWIDGFFPKPNNYLVEKTWEEPLFNREEIKTGIKKEQKEKIKEEVKKRIEEQERFSEQERIRLLEKQKIAMDDVNACKKIKSEIKSRIKNEAAMKGISQLRDCLNM